jgi:hypothetical protein
MRSIAILFVLASSAYADTPALPADAHGWGIDFQAIDAGGGTAAGLGFDGVWTLTRGRTGLLLEGGAGGLMTTHPTDALGGFAVARVGGRLLVATIDVERILRMDLSLDAGVGDGVYWLDGAGLVHRPHAFAGWGTLFGGEHHGMHFELRMEVAPVLTDPDALRAICRGTCTMTSVAPVDLTMQLSVGVLSW